MSDPEDEGMEALQQRLSSDDAGKTTFVENFIKPIGLRIVNPDAIAQALAPEEPDSVTYEAAPAADGKI